MDPIIEGLKSKDIDAKLKSLDNLLNVLTNNEENIQTRSLDEIIIILPSLINTSLFSISIKAIELTPFILRQLIRQIRPLKPYLSNTLPQLIDRLGDSKEKSRELALRALTDFWRLLSSLNPSAQDPNASIAGEGAKGSEAKSLDFLGRKVVELGLGHKTWRVREMTLFWLYECTRTVDYFPLHKFTSAVLMLVEDVHEMVREQAKRLIFDIYPTTSEESRASLNKSLQKSSLRKNTISQIQQTLSETTVTKNSDQTNLSAISSNSILNTLNQGLDIASSSFWSSNLSMINDTGSVKSQDATTNRSHSPTNSVASSVVTKNINSAISIPAPQNIPPMNIFGLDDLKTQLNQISSFFSGKETEDNWEFRDKSTYKIRQIVRANLNETYIAALLDWFKSFEEDAARTLISPRTTLSLAALHMLSDMTLFLPFGFFDASNLKLMSALMRCGVSSRKLVSDASQVATIILIQHTNYNLKALNMITSAIVDKNAQLRLYAVSYLHTFLIIHGPTKYKLMEKKSLVTAVDLIQKSIQKSISDANPKVRELARSTFWVFESIWKERATNLFSTFDTSNKKLVLNDKDVNPATVLTLNNQSHASVALSTSLSSPRNKINRPPSRVQPGSTSSNRPTSAMSRNTQSLAKSTSRQSHRPGTVASNYQNPPKSDRSGPLSAREAAALASRPLSSMRNISSSSAPQTKMSRLPSSTQMRTSLSKSPLPGINENSFSSKFSTSSNKTSLRSNLSGRPISRQGQPPSSSQRTPSGLGKPISMIPSSASNPQSRRPASVLSSNSNGFAQHPKTSEHTNGNGKVQANRSNISGYFSPPGPQPAKENLTETVSNPSIATSPSLDLVDEISMLKIFEPNTPKSDQQSLTFSPKANSNQSFSFSPAIQDHPSLLGGFNLPLPETNTALTELQEKLNAKFPHHKARPSNAAILNHRSRNRESMSGFDAEVISMLPNQKDKLQILLRLSDKLNQGGQVTSAEFRTLNRMSKEMAYTVYPKWHEFWTLARCFEKLLKSCINYLKNETVEGDLKQSCIYLIETLVSHQTPLANEFTIEVMSCLIDCRNLNDVEVGASAIDALITFAHAMDPILCFSTAMAYTKEILFSHGFDKMDGDVPVTITEEQGDAIHISLGSGFLVLSKLIPRCSLDFIQLNQGELGEIVSNGFSFKSSEVRRYVLELVISIHSVIQPIGISLQGFFPNLSENKLRLVELYVK